ncbi:MAG: hypothetical protein ABIS50_19540 [Luteolibacter sp.]|uniref:hypothetical protein n=1 Tax=Luteolibacter sp. TaxID=1962973 RepID=UPI003267A18E
MKKLFTLLALLAVLPTSLLLADLDWKPISLQELVHQSGLIVIARHTQEKSEIVEKNQIRKTSQFEIIQTLKGSSPKNLTIECRYETSDLDIPYFIFPDAGNTFLLFLTVRGGRYEITNGKFGAHLVQDEKILWYTNPALAQDTRAWEKQPLKEVTAQIKRHIDQGGSPNPLQPSTSGDR